MTLLKKRVNVENVQRTKNGVRPRFKLAYNSFLTFTYFWTDVEVNWQSRSLILHWLWLICWINIYVHTNDYFPTNGCYWVSFCLLFVFRNAKSIIFDTSVLETWVMISILKAQRIWSDTCSAKILQSNQWLISGFTNIFFFCQFWMSQGQFASDKHIYWIDPMYNPLLIF